MDRSATSAWARASRGRVLLRGLRHGVVLGIQLAFVYALCHGLLSAVAFARNPMTYPPRSLPDLAGTIASMTVLLSIVIFAWSAAFGLVFGAVLGALAGVARAAARAPLSGWLALWCGAVVGGLLCALLADATWPIWIRPGDGAATRAAMLLEVTLPAALFGAIGGGLLGRRTLSA